MGETNNDMARHRVTQLRDLGLGRLAKEHAWGRWHHGYVVPVQFDAAEIPIENLDDLCKLLEQQAADRNVCMIRGSLINPNHNRSVRLLLQDDGPDKATFRDAKKSLLALDFDGVEAPRNTNLQDLLACAEVVIPKLPPEFQNRDCVVTAKAEHAVDRGIWLRLWYWLRTPITTADTQRWMIRENVPCNMSLLNAVEPIYTATPTFRLGSTDPLNTRIAMHTGDLPMRMNVEVPPDVISE